MPGTYLVWTSRFLSVMTLTTSVTPLNSEEIRAFQGSSEHGLVQARARVLAGERDLRRGNCARAEGELRTGVEGLEDAFDRLTGLDELRKAYLRLAEAALRSRDRPEAEGAAESLARLDPAEVELERRACPPTLRQLLRAAAQRVGAGARGVLLVTSVVRGQAITVDAQPRGKTPQRIELPVGRHFVRVQTPLGAIAYRVDLHEGESLRVGQGETGEVVDEISSELNRDEEQGPEKGGSPARAARRPVLPHRR
jgi:hypothetical protein